MKTFEQFKAEPNNANAKTKETSFWFVLSYDAAAKYYKDEINEAKIKPRPVPKYATNDFRKRIINILLDHKAFAMEEPVETTICFKIKLKYTEKKHEEAISAVLDKMETAFRKIGNDFNFILALFVKKANGHELYREYPDTGLKINFKRLLAIVEKERLAKKES